MKTGALLNMSLAFHLIGLSMSAGVVLTKYLFVRTSFVASEPDPRKWTIMLAATRKLTKFLGVGMGLAILSGLFMMRLAYSAFMYQLWFQLKLALLLLIILLGIFLTRNESKIRRLLKEELNADATALTLAGRIKLFTGLQLGLFIVIIFLASFRFI